MAKLHMKPITEVQRLGCAMGVDLSDITGEGAGVRGLRRLTKTATARYRLRYEQAERKAEKLVGVVCGTSLLEDQVVSKEHRARMVKQTIAELLAGSEERLWAP